MRAIYSSENIPGDPTNCRPKQGIRLLELARNAQEFFRTHGQAERAELLAVIIPGSTIEGARVVPTFKPPSGIIHCIAQETKQAAPTPEAVCPILLPRINRKQTRNTPLTEIGERT